MIVAPFPLAWSIAAVISLLVMPFRRKFLCMKKHAIDHIFSSASGMSALPRRLRYVWIGAMEHQAIGLSSINANMPMGVPCMTYWCRASFLDAVSALPYVGDMRLYGMHQQYIGPPRLSNSRSRLCHWSGVTSWNRRFSRALLFMGGYRYMDRYGLLMAYPVLIALEYV